MSEPTAGPEPTSDALLPALIELFSARGVDRLPTDEIVAALGERLGMSITANRLTRSLKPYGAVPRQYRVSGRRVWGYILSDLAGIRDAELPVESRDARVAEPLVPDSSDHPDVEQEWATRLAMAAMVR